ncbi:MAG: efflux RND transporter permease subunit [Candidatus Binatia bacterium]|nr:efflux RND transporter permease subunit [Candidatus Binatia bacterium]
MNISEPFIRRPVATTLLMVALVAFGVFGYRALPVSDLPNVDFPTILVTASLPGASPDTMASAVATPLERQFSTLSGLESMNSVSSLGTTQITLQFDLRRDIDAAAQDVQAAITRAQPLLPADMPTPPTFQKVNPADQPILFFSLTSVTLPLWQLDEYGQTLIAQRISMVSGVAQVLVFGSQKYAVRVKADPRALASRGLGIDEVEAAIRAANVNLPTGILQGPQDRFTVQATGQLTNAKQYEPVIIAYRNGAPVRLSDVATVIDGVEDDRAASWFGDKTRRQRAIVLAVQRQPGTNTVEVATAVKALLPQLRQFLPPAVELHTLFDRSLSIRESVREVQFTMILALILVVLVIFLFLRDPSATLIPSLALPVSLVGTFAFMQPLGFSIDNLSLLALTLSIGFVVDDAIVMLENIVRHREAGKAPFQAAIDGARQIGFTIISMTLSLVAVFIPVLFMPGIVGRLFHEFAVTISIAILLSGVVSLTLTPMLCSRFLQHQEGHGGRGWNALFERAFSAALHWYERSLRATLRWRAWIFGLSLALLATTLWLFARAPKGFIPNDDLGSIFGVVEADQGVSFEAMRHYLTSVADIIRSDPAVRVVSASLFGTNAAAGSTANQGRVFAFLKPRSEREPLPEVLARLRNKTTGIPGVRVFLQELPTIRIGGQLTKSLYQFTLLSPDTKELYEAAQKLEAELRPLPVLRDVTSDLQLRNPYLDVVIDRDRATALGLSAEQIELALHAAYGDRWISTIYAPNNQYRVILEVADAFQTDPTELPWLYLRSQHGALVPLTGIAQLERRYGPLTVNHAGQLPAVTISFNLADGASLSEAISAIETVARERLPAGITATFQGAAQAFTTSLSGIWILLLAAVLVIYLVLGILYESFLHPITILSGLPSAAFGALLALELFGMELNIYGFVGIVLLIGIVKKNAIMQIDFALEAQREENKSPLEAIVQGCIVRFRPIMMTTMAALFGALPIALAAGGGATSRRPLGVAVVGGLLFSQLVTLYLTPVYYTYLESFASWVRRARGISSAGTAAIVETHRG